MPKVLAQSGDSLADLYDVEGSIAGIENLESKDVGLVHEMGSTIFSERVHGAINVIQTGDILQDVAWNLSLELPRLSRILNWSVVIDTAGRVNHCQLSMGDVTGSTEQDVPFWAWHGATGDFERTILMQIQGATAALAVELAPITAHGPTSPMLSFGPEQPSALTRVNQINFRGSSGSFGAGTVEATAIIYHALVSEPRPSSRGLPLPSW